MAPTAYTAFVNLSSEDVRASNGGCLRVAGSTVALVILAPAAAVVRSWQRWRRGDEARVDWHVTRADGTPAGLARVDLSVDVPDSEHAAWRRRLTDIVVRIAETLRRDDDVYHILVRDPAEAECTAVPVGPQVQALGERFALVMGHRPLEARTAVWLTLPRSRPLASVVDPFGYDPERTGEPEGLVASAGPRWAAASTWIRRGASVRSRVLLFVPTEAVGAVERVLSLLRR